MPKKPVMKMEAPPKTTGNMAKQMPMGGKKPKKKPKQGGGY